MNRSNRRRQESRQAKTGSTSDSFAVHTLLDQGKRHHQAGRLAQADRSYRYCRQ